MIRLHEPDDRRLVGRGHDLGGLAGTPAPAFEGLEGLDQLSDAAQRPVVGVDGPAQVAGRGDEQPGPIARGARQLAGEMPGRFGDDDVDLAVVDPQGEGQAGPGRALRQQIEGQRFGSDLTQIGHGQLEVLGQGLDEDLLVDGRRVDQHGAEPGGRVGAAVGDGAQLILGDELPLHQQLAERQRVGLRRLRGDDLGGRGFGVGDRSVLGRHGLRSGLRIRLAAPP